MEIMKNLELELGMTLFVDRNHLSGPYERTTLATVALDANNHIFDVAYAVVRGETNEDWL